MEQNNYHYLPQPPPRYPAGNRELGFALVLLGAGSFLWNSLLFGGLNLGFGLGSVLMMSLSAGYLIRSGCRFDRYSASLLILAGVICLGFGRSDDDMMKVCLIPAVIFAVNLSFCLASGKNRRSSGGFSSLLDGLGTFFARGFGGMGAAARGLREAGKHCGTAGKKGGAAAMGLLLAAPLAAVLILLLMRSDAAFEGLMDRMPGVNLWEPVYSLLWGGLAAWHGAARAMSLRYEEKKEPASPGKTPNPITWNVVLGTVCLVYCVYLFSQLAYFGGGFSGILPEDYTLAQYARRGFFEMAWLSAINLGLICLSMGLAEKNRLSRWLSLFLGAVTVFLAAAASGKMLLYIGSYGLTRLRVLTETVILWLALTTVLVLIRLFRPGFGYMKGVLLAGLILSGLLLWGDVDAQVAGYNVRAYQRGALEEIDLAHLSSLSDGAVPYLAKLTEDKDPEVARTARRILKSRSRADRDLRSWNAAAAKASGLLEAYPREPGDTLPDSMEITADIEGLTGLDTAGSNILEGVDSHGGFHGDGVAFQSRQFSGTPEFGEGWKPLPAPETVRALCWGADTEEGSIGPYIPRGLIPEVEEGWYFFYDRHGESRDPWDDSEVLERYSLNFTLAVYDSQRDILYYIREDT